MEKYFNKITLLFIVGMVFLVSCSKEDTVAQFNQKGGEIFQSQVVTVDLNKADLSENEYQGMLNGVAVTLVKSVDHKLLFLVPSDATVGLQDLLIPALDNATIHYDVKEALLSGTPEATMVPFFENLNSFAVTLDASTEALALKKSLTSFTAVFENASSEDKTKVANLYHSNKALFDNLLLNDFNSISRKNQEISDIDLLIKHSAAVFAMATGAVVVLSPLTRVEKAFGAALIVVGAYKARAYFLQILPKKFNRISCAFNGILGMGNRSQTETSLCFQSDVSNTVALYTVGRGWVTSDASKTQPATVSFFEDYNRYNYYANKVNAVLTWVNNNVPFADFSLISLEQLPTTSNIGTQITNQEIFSNIIFSVTHPNLTLVSAKLQSDGQLSLKIKIKGTPTALLVESFLNYSYTDDFSSFSGKLPIKISPSLIGTWVLESDKGVKAGGFVGHTNSPCNNIVFGKRKVEGSVVFTQNSYNYKVTNTWIYYNNLVETGTCKKAGDNPDTIQVIPENYSDTYSVDGINIIGNFPSWYDSFQILTPNKIDLGGRIFVRQ